MSVSGHPNISATCFKTKGKQVIRPQWKPMG